MRIWQNNQNKGHRPLIALLLFCLFGPGYVVQAQQPSYTRITEKVSIPYKSATADRLLKDLDNQTSYDFIFQEETFKQINLTELPFASTTLGNVLVYLHKEAGLVFSVNNKTIAAKKESTPTAPIPKKDPGKVKGRIIDEENGQPVAGATVFIGGKGITTDGDGSFVVALPKGSYTATISYVGYGTKEVSEIEVKDNEDFALKVTLQRDKGQLTAVVVQSSARKEGVAALYAQQKASVSMTDGISAAQMGRTADNNVAQALRRLPGVSISDGRFVTIRGLSERYNNVKLNGAEMPSTEPNRKNFSFDVIPTGLVDNIVVAKTFTPDMSAEFAGGQVSVNTLSIPNKNFLTVSVGTGFNTNSTGKDFWGGKRFGSDYQLGNAKERYWYGRDWDPQWYTDVASRDIYNATPENFKNWEAANRMNAKVPNHWNLYKYKGAPTQSYSFSAGLPFSIKKNKFGIVAGVNYRHEETAEDYGSDNVLDADNEQHNNDAFFTKVFASRRFNFTTGIGVVANAGWQNGGHKISWKNMYNNRFVNGSFYQKTQLEAASKEVTFLNDPRRTQVLQTRLEGSHKVWQERLNFSWYADFNELAREQLDERNIRGTMTNGQDEDGYEPFVGWGYLGVVDGGYSHIFRGKLHEKKKNAGADVEVPFSVLGNLQKIKVGYQGSFRDAQYNQGILNIGFRNNTERSNTSLEDFLTPEKFLDSTYYYMGYQSVRTPDAVDDHYSGTLDVRSAFLMGDFSFFNKLHLSGGVRREDSHFSTDGVQLDIGNRLFKDSSRTDDEINWYPSASVIYNLTNKINLRGSYSKTISRFDFRELSSSAYWDIAQNMKTYGTDSLRNTFIQNYDVRVEWYPSADEIISITGFLKEFRDPIELFISIQADALVGRPINLKSATGKGVELNFRKSLGFIHPGISWLKNIYISGNAMYMKMNVQYQQEKGFGKDSVRDRPLQDLVPYSINAGLSWEGTRFSAAVNYGTTGRKLTRSAVKEFEDEYEAPRHIIDLQLAARFLKNRLQVKGNVSDLLAQPIITYRNMGFKSPIYGWLPAEQDYSKPYTDDMNYNKGKDWVNRKFKRGSTWSISVSYNF